MDNQHKKKKRLLQLLSYVLVATLASAITWGLAPQQSKLEQLASVIGRRFVADADQTQIQDAAAAAMVAALGDRWSYYIPASEYQDHVNNQNNSYVGVGITVLRREDGTGYDIQAVEESGPAAEAGILPGDILTHADGTALAEREMADMRNLVMGPKNTKVVLTVLRAGETLEFTVTRRAIHTVAAKAQMLPNNIGLVTIANFHEDAGEETIAGIRELTDQGATALIFDVRNNPGGFKKELVEVLDYLLPEGPLFRSVIGEKEEVDRSDADCLQLPMAVLMNGSSYSAAEFFAAALSEYDWAMTVGEQTSGKGYFQNTIELCDGSAVNLSVGKYLTPNGVNLSEAGGLTPDIPVKPGEGVLTAQEDPQVQAAVQALTGQ